ncbi:MAG: hypothetical protein EPN25_08570 [Nitrospirae bacterium]|nr:MAG: hypothetical protein EPN25_08570 [Nitrospirota bacterium]
MRRMSWIVLIVIGIFCSGLPLQSASADPRRIEDSSLRNRNMKVLDQKTYQRPSFYLTLGVDPSAGATESSTILLRALRGGTYAPVRMQCKWEAISTSGGSSRTIDNDAACETQRLELTPGTYRLRLSYRYPNEAGVMTEGTSEAANYVVGPGFRLEVTTLELDAPQPVAGYLLNAKMVVRNTGLGAAPAFPYRFTADPQTTFNGSSGNIARLDPGREVEIFANLRPTATGRLLITGAVDPQNTLNVLPNFRNHSSRSVTADVRPDPGARPAPPALPVIVMGRTGINPLGYKAFYTICNAEDGTTYQLECDGAGCVPGWSGKTPDDFSSSVYVRNGGSVTPACGGAYASKPALRQSAEGPRPVRRDCSPVTYRLTVKATKNGITLTSSPATFTTLPLGCVCLENCPYDQ